MAWRLARYLEAECALCGTKSLLVSKAVGVCAGCLRSRPQEALKVVRARRAEWRKQVGLPEQPPRHPEGLPCGICVNECRIPSGGRGFCGVWRNSGGRLEPITGRGRLVVYTYLDPHPTNCVATPVCPATTERGYPDYTFTETVEYGFYNLAVFMGGCPLDCLFCQNWEHKTIIAHGRPRTGYVKTVDRLVEEALDPRVTCVCYFGGDPTPHTPHLIAASRRMVEESRRKGQRFKRICWETDGMANPALMRQMARLSLETGGIVKIDWKAWTPSIYEALTGVSGEKAVRRLMENAKLVAEMGRERQDPPLLVVSVLLVPGYVDVEEVRRIAEYVASLPSDVPMVLLAFHPDHLMVDLPPTSRRHMDEAVRAAREAGVREVYVGNEWLLGPYY
jgi:pyruvate formate lyase activating enzyme